VKITASTLNFFNLFNLSIHFAKSSKSTGKSSES